MYAVKHSVGFRETRLLRLKIGENLKELGGDTLDTYVRGPVKSGNAVQAGIGVFAGTLRAALEVPDAVLEGVLDRKLDVRGESGNRVVRDVGTIASDTAGFIGNTLTFQWGKALKNVGGVALSAIRLPQSALMEVVDQGAGFDSYRSGTRASVEKTLAA